MKKMLNPKMRIFCFGQNVKWGQNVLVTEVYYRKNNGVLANLAPSLLHNCEWSKALGLGTLYKVFTKKKCSMS